MTDFAHWRGNGRGKSRLILAATAMFAAAALLPIAASAGRSRPPEAANSHAQLVELFTEWRAFTNPTIVAGRPDYSSAAMQAKAAGLRTFQRRLAAFDTSGWTTSEKGDLRLVQAEMNGLDFFLRILRPWARDPNFYQTIFSEMSDVPAHEGPFAEPTIDLHNFKFPLSREDDRRLTELLSAVPAVLADAKTNLADSNARDLWAYGDHAFRDQADVLAKLEAGTLVLNDLEGRRTVGLEGASAALREAVRNARIASEQFADWVKAEAPRRTGPSGVGKANYDWYLKNVLLSPWTFDDQKLLLQRELDRSLASLRLEEVRNRTLSPVAEVSDAAAYGRFSEQRTDKLYQLLVDAGFISDRPYFREALAAQVSAYVAPADRNFFSHVTALDPLPLATHQVHWIELARLREEPHPSPIRAVPPLFNIYADRSEGLATAMEEVVMHAGLYDDVPRGRELVWIMLATRAARGLASLRVQANEIGLDEAGRFHAEWTPRGWADASSKLIGFEQLLYLRQPGYGPSYIVGKLQLDGLLAQASHRAELEQRPFDNRATFAAFYASGIVPPAIIADEMATKLSATE